jgi:selenide,water dikinase
MGGRVITALNLSAFPEALPTPAIAAILRAAAEVVAEAGGTVAGGHTIRSDEPIFGLAVQGLVHPDRILTKGGARPGDVLVLSKPLGTGIVLAGGAAAHKAAATAGMRRLNRLASEALQALGPATHAVTDVTGFGLLGHAWEMAERAGVRFALRAGSLPLYDGALEVAGAGTRTGGDARNREHLEGRVAIGPDVGDALEAIGFDPQTSGGLLAAIAPDAVARARSAGMEVVGAVEAGRAGVSLA